MISQKSINARLKRHFSKYAITNDKIAIISGHSSIDDYVDKVCNLLGIKKAAITRKKFECGESYICLEESIRHKNAYIFMPITPDVNSRVMETMFFIDALKAAEVKDIHVIMPCLPYARQDRRNDKREHVATRVLAKSFDAMKGSTPLKVITLDLHSPQIESAYQDTHIEPLRVYQLFRVYIKHIFNMHRNVTLASPDFGGVKRLENFIKQTGLFKKKENIAFTHKSRSKHNDCEINQVVGDIEGNNVVMIDDMLDTGGTLVKSATAMKEQGAMNIDLFITHGYFNGNAIENLAQVQKDKIISSITITDTIKISDEKIKLIKKFGLKINVVPTTIIFADVIARIQRNISLSPLYLDTDYIENLYNGISPKKV